MFRRSQPTLDEVRVELMKLVTEYAVSGLLGRHKMGQKQLFSRAEKIITHDVAEQFDEAVNYDAEAACLKLVSEEHLRAAELSASLSAIDVAPYLTLVVVVSEFVLHKQTTQLAILRFHAAVAGRNFYSDRFNALFQEQKFALAELMADRALVCLKLWQKPDWRRMFSFYLLAVAQYQQGKRDAAGNLGPTSTDLEEPCKRSASIIGIDSLRSGESAPDRVYSD